MRALLVHCFCGSCHECDAWCAHTDLSRPSKLRDRIIGKGLQASDGAAVGQLVFTSEEAEMCKSKGATCILYRFDTSVEDIVGLEVLLATD